jgi:hypothetical protein
VVRRISQFASSHAAFTLRKRAGLALGLPLFEAKLLGAVKDWAILADQKGPNRYNAMATNVGSPHRVLIESLPQ